MQFAESEEIASLRDALRRFVAKECTPEVVRKWDEDDFIPRAMLDKLAELDLFGLCIPEEYGGMGRQVIAMAVAFEELARGSCGLSALFQQNVSFGGLNIAEFGSAEQRERFLPPLLAGKMLFAYGLSEPDIGGDLANVKTRAERRGSKVIINGAKRWTSGADQADYICALVRSGPAEAKRRNLSFVLIPTGAKGVERTKLGAMGHRGVALHDVVLSDVEISEQDILGGEDGWNNAWSMLAGPVLEVEKIGAPAIAIGIAEAALAEAWAYSQERTQGGKRICGHQAVRHVLADAQTQLQAARLMLQNAAWQVETHQHSAVATSMAKLFVPEACKTIVLNCQQYVMGAYGYAQGFQMERYVRDILAVPIYGGSSIIQRNNIANLMGLPRE